MNEAGTRVGARVPASPPLPSPLHQGEGAGRLLESPLRFLGELDGEFSDSVGVDVGVRLFGLANEAAGGLEFSGADVGDGPWVRREELFDEGDEGRFVDTFDLQL